MFLPLLEVASYIGFPQQEHNMNALNGNFSFFGRTFLTTKSRKNRDLYSRAVKDNINDEILEEYYKPYRRITYAGKYTKRFTRLTKRLEKANRVNLNNIFKI